MYKDYFETLMLVFYKQFFDWYSGPGLIINWECEAFDEDRAEEFSDEELSDFFYSYCSQNSNKEVKTIKFFFIIELFIFFWSLFIAAYAFHSFYKYIIIKYLFTIHACIIFTILMNAYVYYIIFPSFKKLFKSIKKIISEYCDDSSIIIEYIFLYKRLR